MLFATSCYIFPVIRCTSHCYKPTVEIVKCSPFILRMGEGGGGVVRGRRIFSFNFPGASRMAFNIFCNGTPSHCCTRPLQINAEAQSNLLCFSIFVCVWNSTPLWWYYFIANSSIFVSPTSEKAYRDRRLTSNFELWVEVSSACRYVSHMQDSNTPCLSTGLS